MVIGLSGIRMNNAGDHGSPIYKQNSKSRNFVTGYYVTILRLQLISLMYKNNKESLSRLKNKRQCSYYDSCCPNTLRVLIANPVAKICHNLNQYVMKKLEIGPIYVKRKKHAKAKQSILKLRFKF